MQALANPRLSPNTDYEFRAVLEPDLTYTVYAPEGDCLAGFNKPLIAMVMARAYALGITSTCDPLFMEVVLQAISDCPFRLTLSEVTRVQQFKPLLGSVSNGIYNVYA